LEIASSPNPDPLGGRYEEKRLRIRASLRRCSIFQHLTISHNQADIRTTIIMKFTTALVGAGVLCASTDAFVPAVPTSRSFVSQSAAFAPSVAAVPGRSGDAMMMTLGGGGSKRGVGPKGMSSKITDIFRGVNRKG